MHHHMVTTLALLLYCILVMCVLHTSHVVSASLSAWLSGCCHLPWMEAFACSTVPNPTTLASGKG